VVSLAGPRSTTGYSLAARTGCGGEASALRVGGCVVALGVSPHAGGVRERFGLKAKVTEGRGWGLVVGLKPVGLVIIWSWLEVGWYTARSGLNPGSLVVR
jgi:hypothetical protein